MTSSHSHIRRISDALANFFSYLDIAVFFGGEASQNESAVRTMLNFIIYIPLVIAGIYSFAKLYRFTYPIPKDEHDKRLAKMKEELKMKFGEEKQDVMNTFRWIWDHISFIFKPITLLIRLLVTLLIWMYQNPFRLLMIIVLGLYMWFSSSFKDLYKSSVTLDKWSGYINFLIIGFGIALAIAVFSLFSDKGDVSISKKPEGLRKEKGIFHKFRWMIGDSMEYYKSILMILTVICLPLFILWLISSFSFLSTTTSIILGVAASIAILYLIYKKFNAYEYKTKSWIMSHSDIFGSGYKDAEKLRAHKTIKRALHKKLEQRRRNRWKADRTENIALSKKYKEEKKGWTDYRECLRKILQKAEKSGSDAIDVEEEKICLKNLQNKGIKFSKNKPMTTLKSVTDEAKKVRDKIQEINGKIKEHDPDISFVTWLNKQPKGAKKATPGQTQPVTVQAYPVPSAPPAHLFKQSGGAGRMISFDPRKETLSGVIMKRAGVNKGGAGERAEKAAMAENAAIYIRANWKKEETIDPKTGIKSVSYQEINRPSIFTRILKVIMSLPSVFLDAIRNIRSVPTGAWLILFIELIIIAAYFLIPLVPAYLYTHTVSKKDDLLKEQNEMAADKHVIEKDQELSALLDGVTVDWEQVLSNGLYKKNLEPALKDYLEQIGYKSVHDNTKQGLFEKVRSRLFKPSLTLEAAITYVQTNGPVIITLRNQIKMLNSSRWKSESVKKDEDKMFKTKILLKDPIYTDKQTNIGGYEDMGSAVGSFNYNYAISAWFFIHDQPPSRSKAYTKFTSILNYANKPDIQFFGEKNTLRVTMDNSLDQKQVIYETEDFPLQKWNNVIVNYNGGTLDIFINGKLVSSTSSIVPFMSYDAVTVGADDGVSGGVCNVTYFPTPLSLAKIKVIYKSLKNKNPPIV